MLLIHLLVAIGATASLSAQASSAVADDFNRMTAGELEAGIEKRHPAAYYILAAKLMRDGKEDDAVFWFYAGQLRYRLHLAANPGLPPSGDPALFASFSEVIGRPINEYAFGDLGHLMATIDKVLAWDERTDNAFTSKTTHAAALKDVRGGLMKMREYIKGNADQIRAQRQQNGLPNRKPPA